LYTKCICRILNVYVDSAEMNGRGNTQGKESRKQNQKGVGIRVQGLGFRVEGLGLRV